MGYWEMIRRPREVIPPTLLQLTVIPTSRFGDAIQVVTGSLQTCALKEDGTVYCWGSEAYLGIGSNLGLTGKDYPVPVTVSATENLTNITQISSFYIYTCAVNSSGNVYCWGSGEFGGLGIGSNTYAIRATLVIDGEGLLLL